MAQQGAVSRGVGVAQGVALSTCHSISLSPPLSPSLSLPAFGVESPHAGLRGLGDHKISQLRDHIDISENV